MAPIDWSNNAERREFEHDLEVHRATRRNYSHLQWLGWFSGIVLLPALLVLALYVPVGYKIVKNSRQEKIYHDEAEKAENHTLDYSDTILDTIKRNFYFLTVPCQGTSFILAVAHHFTDYKKWNLLGTGIACLCLPVDMLIFYIEPLGFVGTMSVMVLAFIPFAIIIADAVYPVKEVQVTRFKYKCINIQKNSWTKHLSLTFNQRYNLLLRMTAAGYMFYSTVALVITLMKGK